MGCRKLILTVILAYCSVALNLAYGQTSTDSSNSPSTTNASQVESGDASSRQETEEPSFGDRWHALWDDAEKATAEKLQGGINLCFDVLVSRLDAVLFYKIPTGFDNKAIPLIVLVLLCGGLFFTLRYGFVNVRMFRHCIQVIRGKYDRPEDKGEVSHFQALTSALAATVGLGNIAGVAVAISMGGAGAVFWMWVVAFLGMSMKFTSCTLAQYYRRIKPDGTVLGGPMIYMEDGIRERFPSLAPLGKLLAVVYAVLTILSAFGGGNMFQGNQTFSIIHKQFGIPNQHAWVVGVILAFLVGIVIIGGIRRVGEVTSKLVPLMCAFYCLVCLTIVAINIAQVPSTFTSIFAEAFSSESIYGGFFGALLIGARRAGFSNEAGMGSAAIAHAAAKTEEPVREGIVAMIGPFIDTIVVCTMTALAILITGSHLDPATGAAYAAGTAKPEGVELTAQAFASLGSVLPYFLCLAVFVFAYSTMISWSYYGERAVEYLVGQRGIPAYRVIYLIFVILGPILSLQAVIDFSDMLLLSMSFPNIIGMGLLSGLVAKHGRDYISRLKSGAMRPER